MIRRLILACVLPGFVGAQGIANLPVVDAPPIGGRAVSDLAGAAVLLEGDYNGDGIADVAVSAPNADSSNGNFANVGKVYVVYGTPDGPGIIANINDPAPGAGFVLEGHLPNRFVGEALAAADLNGDGIDDLIASAPRSPDFFGSFAGPNLGIIVVLFGQREPHPVNVNVGSLVIDNDTNSGAGFAINGALPNGRAGVNLAGLGDTNGDGIEDLLIGSEGGNIGFNNTRPTAFLLYGRDGSDAWPGVFRLVDLRPGVTDGSFGTYIQGATQTDSLGRSVAALGDLDGDGMNEFVVGAPLAANGGEESGAAYIIAGKPIFPGGVDLNSLEPDGLLTRIVGRSGEQAGSTLIAPGDMNGDGVIDLAVGSAAANERGGRVDVIHLRPNPPREIRLDGSFDGFSLVGSADERLSSSLAPAGDLDGDGFADLFVGSRDHPDGGRARVVYGGSRSGEQSIDDAPEIGFIAAQGAGDSLGRAVSGGADIDADGSNDLVAGAPLHDPGIENAGIAYRLLGTGDDAAPPMRGALSHAWYDRTAAGQGLLLEYGTRGGQPGLFGAWYTFDSGGPLWLVTDLIVLPGVGRSVTTDLFVTSGGQFGAAFDPTAISTTRWGEVRITQTECGKLLWEFQRATDGQDGRLIFVPVLADLLVQPLCTVAGADPAADAIRARTIGTWWNPARGGEGVIIDLEARTAEPELFFSWFTYIDGRPVWLVGNGRYDPTSRRTVAITVFSARGASFGNAFDPADVFLESRGTVTLRFPSCDAAVLDYAIDVGAGTENGTIDLERFTGGLSALPCG